MRFDKAMAKLSTALPQQERDALRTAFQNAENAMRRRILTQEAAQVAILLGVALNAFDETITADAVTTEETSTP